MSVDTRITVRCDWPGCERGHRSDADTETMARHEAQKTGWWTAFEMDFCPLHPQHMPKVLNTELVVCEYCRWDSSGGRGALIGQWLAHLPEFLGDGDRWQLDVQSRKAADLVPAVSFYTALTEGPDGKMDGACPFCQRRSFHVNVGKQVWYCFGCGRGGDRKGFHEQIQEMRSS